MPDSKRKEGRPFTVAMTMEGGGNAVLTVSGIIGYDDGADAIAFCDAVDSALQAGASALTVRINSVGGLCTDGLAMGDKLRTCGVPVRGEVFGCAESMAAYLLQCCTVRVAHRHATIMLHQPRACIMGTVDELVERARYLTSQRDSMFEDMGKRCGKTGAELSAEHAVEKNYTAREALDYGLLDAIVGEEQSDEDVPAPAPAEGNGAFACRLMPYEAGMRALAMCGACRAEGEEGAPEDDEEGEGEEKTAPALAAAEDDEKKPAPEPEEGEGGEEGEETPAPAAPEKKPEEDEKKKPAEACGLSREEVAAMCREAAVQGAAQALASLGVNPASLPTPGKTAVASAARPTVGQLKKMSALDRLEALETHPELAAEYLAD